MKQEILDLYDNSFNKLDRTIIRRIDISSCAYSISPKINSKSK